MPAVLSKKGVAMIVPIHMNDIEKKEFFEAARSVKAVTDEVLNHLKL